ncbi:dTMP kinase [Parvularcula marina]|uniref:Thymidylate kinase n=1 Tax=Parvularcula marina TaxID=2292771 RepID=A0A371RF56_9PROT|nr:dTMP kinase [Parvularcula marina]RFB04060.1 dTMP kinase [Parvularcula marina]
MTGLFITFEGPEGAGKTTQVTRLAERLGGLGHDVVVTREPGGTKGGEAIRTALLDPQADWSPLAELLMMNAARDVHLREVVLPALAAGKTVISDRFCDSTRAYQGGGGGMDQDFLMQVEKAVCTRMPDLTFIFDLPVAAGLSRADGRGARDRFEQKGDAYHEAVRAAFQKIADQETRAEQIFAGGDIEDVEKAVWAVLEERLPDLTKAAP